jgi:hypothetical protein
MLSEATRGWSRLARQCGRRGRSLVMSRLSEAIWSMLSEAMWSLQAWRGRWSLPMLSEAMWSLRPGLARQCGRSRQLICPRLSEAMWSLQAWRGRWSLPMLSEAMWSLQAWRGRWSLQAVDLPKAWRGNGRSRQLICPRLSEAMVAPGS